MVVGLVLVVACRIAAGPLLFGPLSDFAGFVAHEEERSDQLERRRVGLIRRLDEKMKAMQGLLNGRLTLCQTIAAYREVEANTPELSPVSSEEETARAITVADAPVHWLWIVPISERERLLAAERG